MVSSHNPKRGFGEGAEYLSKEPFSRHRHRSLVSDEAEISRRALEVSVRPSILLDCGPTGNAKVSYATKYVDNLYIEFAPPHTTIGSGELGIPSALPYISLKPAD